jgi:methyl-accepting chemotaxis protein
VSVRHKLYLLLGICVLGFACSLVADRVGKYYSDRCRSLQDLATSAYLELLQARREEKNFLIRMDPAYVQPVLAHVEKVGASIKSLDARDDAMDGEARQALALLEAYRQGFEALAALQRVRGFTEKDGLMGEFVAAARDLDGKFKPVTDKDLQIALLTIRRHEKNWQLRGEVNYLAKVADGVTSMRAMVGDDPSLSAEAKKAFVAVIDTYQRTFTAYVDATDKSNKVIETMVKDGRELMPHFEKIQAFYLGRLAMVQRRVEWVQMAVQSSLGLVVLVVVLWIIRGITSSLTALGAYSRRVASGDLDARAEGRFTGEFAGLRDDTTAMVDNLRAIMRRVEEKQAEATRQAVAAEAAMRETMRKEEELAENVERMQEVAAMASDISRRLSESAQELSAQTEQAASGAELTRNRVMQTATAMGQMNATVLEIAANAGQAASRAGLTRENAATGAEVVGRAGASMAKVDGIATALKQDMASLGQEAQSIGQVVGVINDIADQTNLLALNAAIEAARAGEAGRGFAVVADEVRKLAEKTMVATTEVESRIRAIQDATGRNIASMDQAVAAVADANDLASQSGQAIRAIVDHADAANAQITAIAAAAEEQSAASTQISQAITEIDQVAKDNVSGVEASSLAAHTLADLAGELRECITRLRGENRSPKALPGA